MWGQWASTVLEQTLVSSLSLCFILGDELGQARAASEERIPVSLQALCTSEIATEVAPGRLEDLRRALRYLPSLGNVDPCFSPGLSQISRPQQCLPLQLPPLYLPMDHLLPTEGTPQEESWLWLPCVAGLQSPGGVKNESLGSHGNNSMAFLPAQGLPRLDGQWRGTTEVGWGRALRKRFLSTRAGQDSSQGLLS